MDNTILLTIVLSILGSIGLDLTALVILVIIGLVIIVLIKLFLVLIPAILVAIVVYFLTGDLFWTGIAFLLLRRCQYCQSCSFAISNSKSLFFQAESVFLYLTTDFKNAKFYYYFSQINPFLLFKTNFCLFSKWALS